MKKLKQILKKENEKRGAPNIEDPKIGPKCWTCPSEDKLVHVLWSYPKSERVLVLHPREYSEDHWC